MANTINLKIKVGDDGSLSIVGKEAQKTADKLDEVTNASKRAAKGQRTLDRNLKGTANMTSNGTKQFSKMAQGMTGGLVPAYAVLASNVFALSAAFNFLKRAADVQLLEESQVSFAQNSGVALQSITQRLREASDGMLGFQEAGQAAAIGLAKGFSPSQLEALAKGARKASTALGRDFQDSFDRLVRGASKAEPELLDELGITLRLEEATQKYADAIGKNRDELNSYQRSQAVLIETQRQLNKNFGDFEGATNPFVRLSKTFEDLIKQITQFFLPLFTGLANIINGSAVAAVIVFGTLGMSIIKAMFPMEEFTEKLKTMRRTSLKGFAQSRKALRNYIKDFKEAGKVVVQTRGLGAKGVQAGAQAMVNQGATSPTLQRAAAGDKMTGVQKANIAKALKSAEAQYKQHGRITKGIFKDRDIATVRNFAKSMDMMNAKGASGFQRIAKAGVASARAIQVAYKFTGVAVQTVFQKAVKVAGKASRGIQKVMSFASGIGIAIMIIEMVKQIKSNLFTIIDSFMGILDKMMALIAPFIDTMIRSFLSLVDKVKNGFTGLRNGLATVLNSIAEGIRQTFITALNKGIAVLNSISGALNKIKGVNIPKIDPIPDKAGEKVMELSTEVSNLAEKFPGIEKSVGSLQQKFRDSDFGAGLLQGQEDDRIAAARSESMKNYTKLLETGAQELDKIVVGMNSQDDALTKNKNAFNAIKSLDIPGLFAQIGASTTEMVKQLDGSVKKQKRQVFTTEQQKEALAQLKDAFSDLSLISPVLGDALASATLKSGPAMEKLGIEVSNAAVNLAAFEEGLSSTATAVREGLKAKDFRSAFNSLSSLSDAATQAADGIEKLTGNTEFSKDIRKRFKDMFGKDAVKADILLSQLTQIINAEESIARAQIEGANATGIAATANGNFIAMQQERLKLAQLEIELSTEAGKLRADEIEQEQRLANAKLKSLQVQERLIVMSKAETFGAPKQLKASAENLINFKVSIDAVKESIRALQEAQKGKNPLDEEEFKSEMFAKNMQAAGLQIQFVANEFKILGGLLRQLGPDGEILAGVADGFANVIGGIGVAIETFSLNAKEKFAGIGLALGVVSSMLGGIMSMMNARSQAAIKGIDREIAAEKKKDGSSKKSVERIKKLEKQKEAAQKRAFEMNKKMTMAQIIMQTGLGMISAYATAMMLPPGIRETYAAISVAAVAAMGAAMLAMAASTSFQGGGSVSGAGSTGSVSVGSRRSSVDVSRSQSAAGELSYLRGDRGTGGPENFQPAFTGYKNRNVGGNTAFMVGEQGPELFVPERPGTIMPADDTAAMGAPITANINITALDATGVEDILMEQQGNIIGMIREAANSYGQDFLESVDESTYTSPVARRA